jgi:hypothetical protein
MTYHPFELPGSASSRERFERGIGDVMWIDRAWKDDKRPVERLLLRLKWSSIETVIDVAIGLDLVVPTSYLRKDSHTDRRLVSHRAIAVPLFNGRSALLVGDGSDRQGRGGRGTIFMTKSRNDAKPRRSEEPETFFSSADRMGVKGIRV